MKRLRIRQRAEWKQSLPDLTWPRSLKVTFSNSWFCATKSFKGPIYWISSDIKQLKTPNPHILKAALATQMTVLIAKMYLKVLLVRKVDFFHLNLNYDPSYDELLMRLFLPSKAAVSVVIVLANFLSILQSPPSSLRRHMNAETQQHVRIFLSARSQQTRLLLHEWITWFLFEQKERHELLTKHPITLDHCWNTEIFNTCFSKKKKSIYHLERL